MFVVETDAPFMSITTNPNNPKKESCPLDNSGRNSKTKKDECNRMW